jgi:hypothetical protein
VNDSKTQMAEAIDIVTQTSHRLGLRDSTLNEGAVVHRALRTVLAAARAFLDCATPAPEPPPKEIPCTPAPSPERQGEPPPRR